MEDVRAFQPIQAMDGQQFCLKWDGFQGSITSVFDHLRRDSELVDVTLCCEGQQVRAHRMMLSACSPYFRELFKGLPYHQLAVFLKDTSATDLTAIVEFMYKGSVNVAQSQLASFMKTAEMLQVQGLSRDEEKSAPPSRHTAPSSRQSAPPFPIPRRPPPEPSLPPPPPPPPPPSASPPPKRRRTSEPLPSPDAASPAASPGGMGTPAASPRPASLPSATQQQQGQQQQQYRQEQDRQHQQQGTQQQLELQPEHQGQALGQNQQQQQCQPQPRQQHQGQLQGRNQHHHRQQQQQQQQDHQGQLQGIQQDQHQGLHTSLPDDMMKVEKFEVADDDFNLQDTLDHVTELERYGAGEEEDIGGHRQSRQRHLQQRQKMNVAPAAAQQSDAVPGPSQRLSEDSTSQDERRDGVLSKILERLNRIEDFQQQVWEAVSAGSVGDGRQPMKRLKNIRELEELDERLHKDPELRTVLRSHLSQWCTTDVKMGIKEMLPAMFSPALSRQLSLKGHNQKKSLGTTHVFDVMAETFFLHWKTPRSEVCRLVSRWLSGARDRQTGPGKPARKKRRPAAPQSPSSPSATTTPERELRGPRVNK